MKFCPVCQTRYDEEIMRFCTKDGTPLVEEEAPNFIAMPSEDLPESEDDFGAETVIRRKPTESEITNVEPRTGENYQRENSQRMVISTSEQQADQQVRAKQASYQQPPPKKTSTAAVVLLTILGTIVVIGGGLGIYWLISGGNKTAGNSNSNLNTNQDTNLNSEIPLDNSLFNVNSNVNTNSNTNTNVNSSPSPSPSKSPTPSPTKTPTPSPTPDNNDDNTNSSGSPANTRPTITPTPRTTPAPPTNNAPVNVGNMNGRAVSLTKPVYPAAARAIRANGQVPVQVTVDETGRVTSAKATSGHPLLRQAAENAARSSRFNPATVSGQTVKSIGTVVYNFVGN